MEIVGVEGSKISANITTLMANGFAMTRVIGKADSRLASIRGKCSALPRSWMMNPAA